MREYGVPVTTKLRYAGLRGILWYWFSRYIRQVRDKEETCISCGFEKDEYHGGHFVPTGSCSWDGLVFSERNVNKECAFCNQRDKIKLKYAKNLDAKYGEGTAQSLRDQYYAYRENKEIYKNWKKSEYVEKIEHYRKLVLESS